MLVVDKVIDVMVEMSVNSAWDYTKRREGVVKILKILKLNLNELPKEFDDVYIFTLVEWGILKSRNILDFFRHEFVRAAFRRAYGANDLSILEHEAEEIIDWNHESKEFGELPFLPRNEFASFSAVFTEIANRSRTPVEIRRDMKLDDLYKTVSEIQATIESKLNLEEIREVLREIQSKQSTTYYSFKPLGEGLKVFISSKMLELRDLREILDQYLDERGIDAWVYEENAGARPESIGFTSLKEVEESDIYIGLFWRDYGEITIEEYRHARMLGKPCFIYIRDKNLSRDSRLESFLKKEVYDPNKGVSYDYFDSAIALSKQVSTDIMKWLFRSHREMTAAITSAQISQDEITRLNSEVSRLQRASREQLPQGTPLDYLASLMRGWFHTLGYAFESYDVLDKSYFEWIINVPARRGYDRILVRGVDGVAELSDLTELIERTKKYDVDEGWLVANRRVSPSVRTHAEQNKSQHIYCYTFDELLDEEADFSRYIDWLENEIKQRGIDKYYVPLIAKKDVIDPKSKRKITEDIFGEREGWLDRYIEQWLDDPSKEHISILGEFGTGKTWFCLHYAWVALQRYKDAKAHGIARTRLPLLIPLRDYAKAVSVESLFSEFFFRKHEIPLSGYSVFEQLNRMGKFLLIFDGFDEMAARVDRQQMINNFWGLARVVVPGAKVILTCRNEHFPTATEGRSLLNAELQASTSKLIGEPPQFEVVELQLFDERQIRKVLSYKTDSNTVNRILNHPQLADLIRRPIMTELILDALIDVSEGKPIDLARCYLYAARRKMERDIKAERTFTSLSDKLFFLCELSWEMISTDRMSLNYREFPDRLRHIFPAINLNDKSLDYWHYDMMGQTMLIRNADGDYTPAHRSLLEFFVAYKFAAELGILSDDFIDVARTNKYVDRGQEAENYTWSQYNLSRFEYGEDIVKIAPLAEFNIESIDKLATTFGATKLTPVIVELMSNMIQRDKLRIRFDSIIQALEVQDDSFLGGNSLTLLAQMGEKISEQSYAGMNLRGLSLDGINLENTSLAGANLSLAELKNVSMVNTDFSHALLKQTYFEEYSKVERIYPASSGSELLYCIASGYVYIISVDSRAVTWKLFLDKYSNTFLHTDPPAITFANRETQRLEYWDVNSGLVTNRSEPLTSQVISIGYGADDKLAILLSTGRVEILDTNTFDIIEAWQALNPIKRGHVQWSRDNRFLITYGTEVTGNYVHIWENGHLVYSLHLESNEKVLREVLRYNLVISSESRQEDQEQQIKIYSYESSTPKATWLIDSSVQGWYINFGENRNPIYLGLDKLLNLKIINIYSQEELISIDFSSIRIYNYWPVSVDQITILVIDTGQHLQLLQIDLANKSYSESFRFIKPDFHITDQLNVDMENGRVAAIAPDGRILFWNFDPQSQEFDINIEFEIDVRVNCSGANLQDVKGLTPGVASWFFDRGAIGMPEGMLQVDIDEEFAQLLSSLDSLDPRRAGHAEQNLEDLRDEFTKINDGRVPDAKSITRLTEWLLENCPELVERLGNLFSSPAADKLVALAGPSAINWLKRRFRWSALG